MEEITLYGVIEIAAMAISVLSFVGSLNDIRAFFFEKGPNGEEKFKSRNLIIFCVFFVIAVAAHQIEGGTTGNDIDEENNVVADTNGVNHTNTDDEETNIAPDENVIEKSGANDDDDEDEVPRELPGIPTAEIDATGKENLDVTDYLVVKDTLTEEDQSNEYIYKPAVSGEYCFSIIKIKEGTRVAIQLIDEDGHPHKVNGGHSLSFDGSGKVELEADQTYRIQAELDSEPGYYSMKITGPKAEVDISEYTALQDSIEYSGQKNRYSYTPKSTGKYRMKMKGSLYDMKLTVEVTNDAEKPQKQYYSESNKELEFTLNEKVEYKISICQTTGNSFKDKMSYTFRIKPITSEK